MLIDYLSKTEEGMKNQSTVWRLMGGFNIEGDLPPTPLYKLFTKEELLS